MPDLPDLPNLHKRATQRDVPVLSPGAEPVQARRELWRIQLISIVLLLVSGYIEGWFKRTFYSADAICYLDISRAIPTRDWKMVFNPLWSAGYPALVAAIRPLFAAGAEGEWSAVHVLNLLVLLFGWAGFSFLIHGPVSSPGEDVSKTRFLWWVALSLFLAIELTLDSVSRVGPDLLVSALFLWVAGLMMRVVDEPAWWYSFALGLVLGAGYWVKGIFVPLSVAFLVTLAAALAWKGRRLARVLPALAMLITVAAPYTAALSWSYGRFTLGQAGSYNYAYWVNRMPGQTNWQGGPEQYGNPIHPTRQLMKDPDLFEFGEPYHNTYPPFGNVIYWYEGYRRFWSVRYQLTAIGRNTFYLLKILLSQPMFYAWLASTGFLAGAVRNRQEWLTQVILSWPFFLTAQTALMIYVLVHVEARYLGSFLLVLALVPFIALSRLRRPLSSSAGRWIMALLAIGALLNFAVLDHGALANISRGFTFTKDPDWVLAEDLKTMGLKPGDKVAAIGGPYVYCTWAFVDQLHIVAELGGTAWDPHNPEPSSRDVSTEFWQSSPDVQARILSLFRQSGAVAVIAPKKPPEVDAPGWTQASGTNVWVHRL